MLLNLVNNAIKFTERGGVTVIAKRLNSGEKIRVRFEVQDTGVGIPKDATQKIFHRYQQQDESTTRIYGGTGLGLNISQQLVELMGGKIDVHSELNEGTTFFFEVALSRPREETPVSLSKPLPTAPGTDVRVLVVEDDATNRMVVEALLKKLGCIVQTASNGKEAVRLIEGASYDLVLMDCYMPVVDGFEATRRIREMPGGKRVPIVALTASVTEQDRKRCMDAGMNDSLAKPIRLDRLRSTIDRWVHLKPPEEPPEARIPSDAPTTVSILDPDAIEQLRIFEQDDPGFMRDVLQTYLDNLDPSLSRIDVAAKEGDLDAVRNAAHALKGASRQVGALMLGQTLEQLEHAAGGADALALIDRVAKLAESARTELQSLVAKLQ